MENKKLYELKSRASQLKPVINIGKSGINEAVIEELKNYIKRNRLVKVKVLKTAVGDENIDDIASRLAAETKSELVEIRGRSVTLYR
ncbi:protein of unknown function UPF0044 [Methanosalsum zhilinae DSM 4017]|uniref:CRM domain-containing protein n=1 Tax=Methanosalsum zhilinae (strain DSM 4017 / NBRC 107636 / OCM 62 / WeN5) TaxID=679901 RepID=F7XQR4_METZD|nr:YhbY family RNA-binding protein [Methanosalsum zhilinae]AEH61665.1 protein of unknown function UPF0044 [Methanosalsum zhilinae DSM 4017]